MDSTPNQDRVLIPSSPLSAGAVTVGSVSAPYRHDAFETAQFCIDTSKKSVPMGKRELWRGAATWSGNTRAVLEVPGP